MDFEHTDSYKSLIAEIKNKIRGAQYNALKAVNTQLIELYWDIGSMIVGRQVQEGWGKSVVKKLSIDIQKEFPGLTGFSLANMWRMRSFYLAYEKNEKLVTMLREISWSKHIRIVEKCKNDLEREFYIRMTRKFGWSHNVLIHHIENQSYEKYLLNQTNFEKTVPKQYQGQAKLALKDEYNFSFLEVGEVHSEHELELGLVKNIRSFLMEMGGDFAFLGNQYRLEVEDEEFYVDLLLFHRKLNCLVAVELKTGKFKPEYSGKMQFYLSVLNKKVRNETENPSIGIIICKSKKRTFVEYTLNESNAPIGVASYTVQQTLPDQFKNLLPEPEDIARKISRLEL